MISDDVYCNHGNHQNDSADRHGSSPIVLLLAEPYITPDHINNKELENNDYIIGTQI